MRAFLFSTLLLVAFKTLAGAPAAEWIVERTLTSNDHRDRLLAASPDGQFLFVRNIEKENEVVKLLDSSGNVKWQHTWGDGTGIWVRPQFSPDSKRLLVVNTADRKTNEPFFQSYVRECNVESGKERLVMHYQGRLTHCEFATEGIRIVAFQNETAHPPSKGKMIGELGAGAQIIAMPSNLPDGACEAVSRDGKRVAYLAYEKQAVTVWDLEKNLVQLKLGQREKYDDESISDVRFSNDGHRLLTLSSRGEFRVLDAETGAVISTFKNGLGGKKRHNFGVISPDGKLVVTPDLKQTAVIWDADTGQPLTTLNGERWAYEIIFSSDGQRILTHEGNAFRVWVRRRE